MARSPDPGTPCDHYEMTNGLRDWLVEAMRKEVLAEVSRAGLNRMAVVKGPRGGEEE